MKTEGKSRAYVIIRTMIIVIVCILVNFFGRHIADVYELPLWMDSFGTVFAAYVLGPINGAIVGCTGNIVYSFWDPTSLAYSLTSIFIGISIGLFARKKYFDTFFGATSVAGGVTLGSVVISSILNLAFYDGNTGNIWGDGVAGYLSERGIPHVVASAIGELYLDFLDKLATVLLMFFFIRFIRYIRKRNADNKTIVAGMMVIPLLFGLVFCPVTVKAADAGGETYIQKVFDKDNGLPCGHANDIAQTNDGILWVGSYAGLYRYNGSSFKFMDEFTSVKNVNCLYVDEEGRLWIGTNDSGIIIAIEEKESNILDSSTGLTSDSVRSIVQSSDGDYYIGTSDQMAVVKLKTGITVSKEISEIRYAQSLAADDKGNVAAVTAEGKLFIINDGNILYEISPTEENMKFAACAFDEKGILYVGTTDGRLLKYVINEDGEKLVGDYFCTGVRNINQIRFLEGRTWILADNGIGYLDGINYVRVETGDFDSSVVRMTSDYQGNLWFASTRHGLLQLSESKFPNLSTEYGLDPAVVNSTAIRDGLIYIGTDDGLSIVRMSNGVKTHNDLTDLFDGVRVRCIKLDKQGNLWICGYGVGLVKYPAKGELTVFSEEEHKVGSWARVCTVLSDGSVAVGSDTGVTIIKNDKPILNVGYGDELGSSQILTICELPDGELYVGTDGNGVVIIKDKKVIGHLSKEDGLSSGVILRLVYDDETGTVFGVTSNGLCYIKDGAISTITGFPYSNNYDIVLDDDGEAFVMGSAGVYVVKKKDLLSGEKMEYDLMDSSVGLRGALTANSFNEFSEDENLYLSTDRGVVKMNLDDYRSDQQTYRLKVSGIKIDDVPVPIERGMGLTIGREVNSIEFIPEIVNYTLEDPEVSYYLEGIETDYKSVRQSELGGVVYTNLPSGEYVFHLAIIDPKTGEIMEESTYGFVKEKSIYDNSWFLVYMIVVGGLFIGWFSWFVTRFATQRTLALQQERLSLALKQVQMGNETILAIAKTVDAKDSMTSQHSQRVSDYSVLIAQHYGFEEEEQENLRKAALLHDIGKIGIPDAILNKPARLDDREYEIMKTHVTRGAEILKDFTLIEHVVEGARYHHERFDGSGYPDGLKGNNIPLYGRIIAIADAFDAMTANRVYRKRLDFSEVLDELKKGRGTQFDPDLMDVFLKLIDDGEIDIKGLYGESKEVKADE